LPEAQAGGAMLKALRAEKELDWASSSSPSALSSHPVSAPGKVPRRRRQPAERCERQELDLDGGLCDRVVDEMKTQALRQRATVGY
jgi:hypothetical protein